MSDHSVSYSYVYVNPELTVSSVDGRKPVLQRPPMHMGDRIRAQRDHLGLSQEDVAAHFGITREAIANWERGANLPRGKRLVRLGEILHCSVQYLLGRQGDPMPTKDDEFVEKMLSVPPSRRRTLEAVADTLINETSPPAEPRRRANSKKGR